MNIDDLPGTGPACIPMDVRRVQADAVEAIAARVEGLRAMARRHDLAGVERVVVLAAGQMALGNPASSA